MQVSPNVSVEDFLKISKRKTNSPLMPYVGCGLYTTRLDDTVIFSADGENYYFGYIDGDIDPGLFLRDIAGYIYKLTVNGIDGAEQAGLDDGVLPAIYPEVTDFTLTGNNYRVTTDSYFRIRNFTTNKYHYLVSDNRNIGIETPGVSTAAGPFLTVGNLFKFESNILYLYDTPNAAWRAPYAVADINHRNAQIQLT